MIIYLCIKQTAIAQHTENMNNKRRNCKITTIESKSKKLKSCSQWEEIYDNDELNLALVLSETEYIQSSLLKKNNNIDNTDTICSDDFTTSQLFELVNNPLKFSSLQSRELCIPRERDNISIDAQLYYRAELICLKSGLKLNASNAIQKYLLKNPIKMITDTNARYYFVKKIEYILNVRLLEKFKQELKALPKDVKIIFTYHGTADFNIASICEYGFTKPGDKYYVSRSHNLGFFGAGIYSSEFPSEAYWYTNSNALLLCAAIVGRQYKANMEVGRKLVDGYDSHISDNDKEIVIFHNSRILPLYCIHFESVGLLQSLFTYFTG